MPYPHHAPGILPHDICVASSTYTPSPAFVALLVDARSSYAWPRGVSAAASQQRIRSLEQQGAAYLADPTSARSHELAVAVSEWAGNNDPAQRALQSLTEPQQVVVDQAFRTAAGGDIAAAMTELITLPGISVVIASKMLRFVTPSTCGAIDRHASYFTNSLPWCPPTTGCTTAFLREWTDGNHRSSRLAVFTEARAAGAITKYTQAYLPLLVGIAASMNTAGATFTDGTSAAPATWTAADVEMAMYGWWAMNGPR